MGIQCKPMGVLQKLIVKDENRKAKEAALERKTHRKSHPKKTDAEN